MRRIIAYIYHYKNEAGGLHKCGNVGFCRVESGGDGAVVNICLKDKCGVEGMAHIYMLQGKVDMAAEHIYHKIKLNRSHTICNGTLNARICVSECLGLCLECGGLIYVVLWNECPENLELVENVAEMQRTAVSENFSENRKVAVSNNVTENKKNNIPERNRVETTADMHKKAKKDMENFDRIYNRLCKVRMILNGSEYPAVKLKPHELIMLPRSCWRMANNVFLMESYYRYGHILFMLYEGQYVLAVPWQNQRGVGERARQFGFAKCIAGYEYGRCREEKLYWIKYL